MKLIAKAHLRRRMKYHPSSLSGAAVNTYEAENKSRKKKPRNNDCL